MEAYTQYFLLTLYLRICVVNTLSFSDPSFGETPVHEWKTAFITIKHFRPMLSRVPLGPAQQGMSPEPHIVLEVDSFEIKGSTGVDVWGKPVNAEFNEDVRLWVEGMREGGGNGYVTLFLSKSSI